VLVFWHFAKFKKPSNTDTKKFIKNLYTHTSIARVFPPHSFVNRHHLSARERYSSFSSDPCQRVLPGSFSRILSIRFVRGKFKNLNPPPKQRQPSWWIYSILIMSSASTLESTIYVRDDDEEDTNFNGKIELILVRCSAGNPRNCTEEFVDTKLPVGPSCSSNTKTIRDTRTFADRTRTSRTTTKRYPRIPRRS